MGTKFLWIPGLAAALATVAATTQVLHSAAAAGTISGTVTFTGTPPKMRPIDMAKEPSCAKAHPTPVSTETVVTGPNNTLQYVVVYISGGDQGSAAPAGPVRFDQKGCQYVPHLAVLQPGQQLDIYNNDPVLHNIHPLAKTNPEWNKSEPPGAPPIHTSYEKPEFIAVKCNVHPWMHGYFVVIPTSHYGVTNAEGKYEITGLPPGKYTLTAWQEHFGTMTQQVTVGATGGATANFVFKALPY